MLIRDQLVIIDVFVDYTNYHKFIMNSIFSAFSVFSVRENRRKFSTKNPFVSKLSSKIILNSHFFKPNTINLPRPLLDFH